MVELVLFGIVQFGLGQILFTIGARLIPAFRTSLLNRLQTVLGPMWVWLAFGEIPRINTLVGGALVLASTIGATLATQNLRPPKALPSPDAEPVSAKVRRS
jgi:drug/metabolite transporter (DMT)-like permease